MTYCVGMKLSTGLVFMSDTRTNAGVDNISTFRKMYTWSRPGERVNEDYHFWTVEQFQKAIASGDMLEHAIVHGRDFYGTPLAEVEPHRQAGIGILLVIDVQGAASVRQKYPHDHVSVFVMAPSDQDLEARLRSRGSEDEAKIQRRLQTAREEVGRANEFDHQLVNADRTEATETLEAIIRDQFYLRGF